ncbi:ATP-grasp domain-containing protein [Asanoa siamensis]|uniref:ATP-grasp fold PylC-type domain-containing protein n=1 Tax=Asanoa siamensis TaxID=926357 RepID=A0ABQ4CUJ9_9ACTN|nr:ATP-grasp domain-containing protein [Asanoa siamensis]GIF74976.1 hypothetical protein Asi02nite_44940 [Asanoa siamensis]
MRRFLVTGAGGPAGKALLAALAERGYPATGVDAAPDGAGVDTVPFADHPCFLAEVLRAAARHRAGIVVPTVSEELPPLAAAAQGRRHAPWIVVGTPPAVAAAADKWRTARLLDLAGVPVPRTLLAGWPEPDRLGVPYLSKPRRGRGGRGVRLHGTPGAGPPPTDDDHVLQEYAPGAEYAVDLYGDAVVVLRKTLLRQGLVGNAVTVTREEAPDVADVARAASVPTWSTTWSPCSPCRRCSSWPCPRPSP